MIDGGDYTHIRTINSSGEVKTLNGYRQWYIRVIEIGRASCRERV